jgi:hypothetical protein
MATAVAFDDGGDKRRRPKLNAWSPKKWKAVYDRVVAYHVMGKKNNEIAATLNMTPEHISTILNQPHAIELKLKMEAAIRDKMAENIPNILEAVSRKTALRLQQILDDDELFKKAPLAIIDRGLEVLKGLSHLKGGGNGAPVGGTIVHGNAIIIPQNQAEGLIAGFTKSDEARRIHALPEAT